MINKILKDLHECIDGATRLQDENKKLKQEVEMLKDVICRLLAEHVTPYEDDYIMEVEQFQKILKIFDEVRDENRRRCA